MPIGDAEWMARSKELLAKIEEWDAANKAKALNEFAASILSQTGFNGDAPFQPMRWQSSEYKPAEETWAVVELLGHNRHAGRLSEEEKFGGKLGRLDVPLGGPCSDETDNWCPRCGRCKCPDPAGSRDDPKCPLHAPDSRHGEPEKFMTLYFSHGSVFRLTVVGEAEARAVAGRSSHRPVEPWELPKAPAAIGPVTEIDTYDAQDGDEPDDGFYPDGGTR